MAGVRKRNGQIPNGVPDVTRRAAAVDANQSEIVAAFRAAGCTVQLLHAVGKGCPDLLVGVGGFNLLVEVKDGAKVPSARKLTPDQIIWHRDWGGHVSVIDNVPDALDMVSRYRSPATVPLRGQVT